MEVLMSGAYILSEGAVSWLLRWWASRLSSCLVHSLYTSRVPLHPHRPCRCQMSIFEQHFEWISFVCVCMLLCVCFHLFSPSWGGGTAAASVWRQAASERHPSQTLPSWSTQAHMHRGKCIHIYHRLCKGPTVNNIFRAHNTHRAAHIFHNLYLPL